jgi:5'-methylthioadenosine phosphorylase
VDIFFIPRHGKGHRLLPSEVNNRANIYAFKTLGVDRIVSVSAAGSLKEEIEPGHILLPDQFVDRTNSGRHNTFFGEGIVAHIPFSEPVCPELSSIIAASADDEGITAHKNGTYLNMEGPAFSTFAESKLYRSWGMHAIGMTVMNEARLSREAGICYACMAMITDYDCWHILEGHHEEVSVEKIMEILSRNTAKAKKILMRSLRNMPEKSGCICHRALENAIVTDRGSIPAETLNRLRPIIDSWI